MICKSCLYPDTKPDLHFVDGECSACRNYKNRPAINWDLRKAELLKLLDKHDGKCIVGSSGGKDSHAIVIKLLELGAEVITVNARTCMLTEVGRQNLDNLARFAPGYEIVPNMTQRAELNRMGLDMVGDIELPEHWAIFSTPFRVAVEKKIPLIFYGENSQDCYGGPPGSEQAKQMTRRWTNEYGGYLGMRPSDVSGMDMEPYTLPSQHDMDMIIGVEAHFLGAYLPWDSHENAKIAIDHGMKTFGMPPSLANWWEWENLDSAIIGIHDYFMWLKYGYGRMAAQLSVDIRKGLITKEEAQKKCNDGWYPYWYMEFNLNEILDHIGMSRPRFDQLVQQFGSDRACA